MKEKVIVSRKWRNPEIRAYATKEEVGAEIDLTAFLDSIVEEIGNPTMLVTKAALRAKLEVAKDAVLKEMKETTTQVV